MAVPSGSVEKFHGRRRLFTDEHWASLLAPPTEKREIVSTAAQHVPVIQNLMKNNCRINMKK